MARRHTFVIAAMIALAAVSGAVALSRTLGLGAASRHPNDALIVARTQQLNRFERSLHRQLANAPKVPTAAPAVSAQPAPVQRVVYVRPKPIIVHKHRAGGEHEAEQGGEHEGGFDD
jgi:hypothetical protein